MLASASVKSIENNNTALKKKPPVTKRQEHPPLRELSFFQSQTTSVFYIKQLQMKDRNGINL